ncbi:MAG TPA: sensor histidine kinase [Solirubrobacteraceae bacterium]|nr:sensor histidine kinase [Solirubrobacteraceae bacterium]
MAERLDARAARGDRVAPGARRLSSRSRGTPLYARVVAINAAIVTGATLVLMLSPATVRYPVTATEAIVLVGGVVLVVIANAFALRISFGSLARAVARMETVDLLQPQQRLPVVGGPEARAVVAGLNQMLARLETERRESSRRTLAALEGERWRITQELHDEIGQRLTALLLQLGNLAPDVSPELRERVSAIQESARATLDEVSVLAWQLRPGILDDLGLLRALEALVESLEEQAPRVRLRSSLPASLPALDTDEELAIYRIVQEALTNAIRHAGAGEVALAIAVEGERVRVSVTDDGVGIPRPQAEDTGIRGMRERALAIGATLAIGTAPGGGTRVALRLGARPEVG